MPVLDHEIHERTRQSDSARYGCHNKPRMRQDIPVKDGHRPLGDGNSAQHWRFIKDFGSLECRYDMSLRDRKCEGCEHLGSGEEYDRSIRAKGR